MVDANTTIGVFCAVPVRCVAMPGVRCRQTALNPPTMSALGGIRWRKVACLPPLSAVVTRQRGGSSRPCGGSSTLSGGKPPLSVLLPPPRACFWEWWNFPNSHASVSQFSHFRPDIGQVQTCLYLLHTLEHFRTFTPYILQT